MESVSLVYRRKDYKTTSINAVSTCNAVSNVVQYVAVVLYIFHLAVK